VVQAIQILLRVWKKERIETKEVRN